MKSLFGGALAGLVFIALANSNGFAQTFAPTPKTAATQTAASQTVEIQELTKKIDEQNAKIDMLSQQILKLQQAIDHQRPGVIIGEGAPSVSASATSTSTSASPEPSAKAANGSGSNHIVARGETLTSIAKMHNVSVGELQKYNHIDNPLKLQAGQTLLIPPSPIPTPSSGE
ncbi:MAG TPA: LysM domain-containing protein [Chthoniobacterales bacterium]|jgi:LysM repeat protein|nr:LysM domain-containing protein [Chthoniobacterales bacterium]